MTKYGRNNKKEQDFQCSLLQCEKYRSLTAQGKMRHKRQIARLPKASRKSNRSLNKVFYDLIDSGNCGSRYQIRNLNNAFVSRVSSNKLRQLRVYARAEDQSKSST